MIREEKVTHHTREERPFKLTFPDSESDEECKHHGLESYKKRGNLKIDGMVKKRESFTPLEETSCRMLVILR